MPIHIQYNLEGMKMILEEHNNLTILEASDGVELVEIYKNYIK